MKKKFEAPKLETMEYVASVRLNGSGEGSGANHAPGGWKACANPVNASNGGFVNSCTGTNQPNSHFQGGCK